MSYKFLSQEQADAITSALAPYFIGREGETLVYASDTVGKAVYDSVQVDISNLYDFKADIESTSGAGLVGIADLSGNFTAVNVEGALVELFNGKLNSSAVSAYGLTLVAAANAAAARTTLGLGTAAVADTTAFQGADSDLAAIAAVTFSANTSVYWTGSGAAATYTLTSFGRTLAGAADAATARASLGAGTVSSVGITGSTGLTVSGSPVTGSGTITLTLSSNLQGWSGVATTSKADDSAVVKLTGAQSVAGAKTFSDIVTCSVYFQATGASAGFRTQDRTTPSDNWVTYADSGTWRVYSPNNEDVLSVDKTSGFVSDKFGRVRSVPLTTQNADYTFVATDAGRGRVKTDTTARSYTVNNNVHAAGDVLTALNDNSTANVTIVQGTGVTLYLAGTTTTGNRTLAPRGYATIFMASASVGYVSGPGVT